MKMKDFIKNLKSLKIVPVIKMNDAKNAYELGKALMEGGLPVAEVTFRSDAAADSIGESESGFTGRREQFCTGRV